MGFYIYFEIILKVHQRTVLYTTKHTDNFIISCRLFTILHLLYEGIFHDQYINENFLSKH